MEQLCQFSGGHAAVSPRRGGDKVHMVPCMDHSSRGGVFSVNPKLGGKGGVPVEYPGLTVYFDCQGLSVASQQVSEGVAVHHQKFHHCEAAAAEQLGRGAVEQDLTAVTDEPQTR